MPSVPPAQIVPADMRTSYPERSITGAAMSAMIVVTVSVFLTFLPINFLHPVRVKRLRPLNLGVFFLWSALSIYSLLMHFDMPHWAVVLFIISGIYLYCIGAVLQFLPALGKSE